MEGSVDEWLRRELDGCYSSDEWVDDGWMDGLMNRLMVDG